MANGACDPVISRLINVLQDVKNLPSAEDEVHFLNDLLRSKELNALVSAHNKILSTSASEKFFPLLSTSMQVMMDVLEVLAPRTHTSDDCKELFFLLQTPHIQGILCAHDAVAQKDYNPHLPEIPIEVDEDEETIKIVQLVKSNEPLNDTQSAEPIVGATIKTDEETGKIVIARVMHGGAADRSGLIHVGDEVVEVNNINVEGKTPADVLTILQNSEGTITFKLVPAASKFNIRESKIRVRAHFDYSAADDQYIPCKEAGLDFKKGDVLHIVAQDDVFWWQARKEGDRLMRAGLIPCQALQEKRIIQQRSESIKNGVSNENEGLCFVSTSALSPSQSMPSALTCHSLPIFNSLHHSPLHQSYNPHAIDETEHETRASSLDHLTDSSVNSMSNSAMSHAPGVLATPVRTCGIMSSSKVKKIVYDTSENDDFDRELIPTYEEVAKLYPRPGIYRPIVLIGAPGIGRNELKRRLISTNPQKFRTPIPYTSRDIRAGEENGKEYNFVTRQQMEELIQAGKFIEYGEYKGNLYGTSSDSVREIINAGFVCILNPHYQALKMLRTPELKPYIIYIKPPPLDELKDSRNKMHARSTFDANNSRGFTEEEFNEIMHSSRRIEYLYDHFFDEQIVNADLAIAFEQLVLAVNRLETEPLWVPASWVQ